MSIQADQLVYDYLSRAGDAAHGVLPPAQRLKFVSALRARIDAERAAAASQSVAEVRQLLRRLGDPEALVHAEALRPTSGSVPAQPGPAGAGAPTSLSAASAAALRRSGGNEPPASGASAGFASPAGFVSPAGFAPPSQKQDAAPDPDEGPVMPEGDPDTGAATTTVAERDEILDVPAVPIDDEPASRAGVEDTLPGAGGETIAPIKAGSPWWREPPTTAPVPAPAPALPLIVPSAWPEPGPQTAQPVAAAPRRWAAPAFLGRLDAGFLAGHKRETLAALLLFAGGVFSSIVVVVIGYAVAMTSFAWTAKDKRFALLGLPALTVAVFVVGVWLQATGRWGGTPVAGTRLSGELRELVAVFPRVIGLLAALFFAWRLARIGGRR